MCPNVSHQLWFSWSTAIPHMPGPSILNGEGTLLSELSAHLTKENLKENHQTLNDIRMSDNTTLAPPASNQGPTTPRKGPPKFKQRQTRQFKSKPPKKGVKGFGDDIPGMEGLGTVIVL
ncbi:retinal cone rhodopsin-sensitive cGMP 3',5'-cyclic phosphodiesterase subunit gamma isoform X3 [Mustela lutreola]|uniref:retinal cone rhodopsin-sensitive cGMP 3',5'-cyclic phosphodiesterase subunit gamma isoform X3 n=1 Tax=Mustela lutreola TaxID=9666 RepID=UPI0027979BB3|nr:retinal cone rhodopsin-sensitive cGMP 3',5'-cyclic phosphodiesterase subunit gamma isoform X3 [Mustela lutreola]